MLTNTLTIPTLNNQLSNIDAQLARLQEQTAQTKELKRAIANKKKLAHKAVNKLESGLEAIEKAFLELGEAGTELKEIALKKINEYFKLLSVDPITELAERTPPEEDYKSGSLVEFPKKENTSNEYFNWETTSNSAVSTYFNVAKAKAQATYIASNNKKNLESVGTNLARIIGGISYEIRNAVRLTDYKYELKIWGLDDDTIGWLTQWNYSKPFYPQIVTTLKRLEVTKDMELTRENLPKCGGLVVNRFFHAKLYALEVDGFDKARVRQSGGEEFEVEASDWYIVKKDTLEDDESTQDAPQDDRIPIKKEANSTQNDELLMIEKVNALTPVIHLDAATESIKDTKAEIVPDEWEELSAIARYNHSQEKLYIKFSDKKISESWFNYLHKIKAITDQSCSKKKRKGSYYLILDITFASAKVMVNKYFFENLALSDKDTSYLDSKNNKLYIGVNYKNKAENFITQIKKLYNLPSVLEVRKATVLTSYKYEVTGTVMSDKETEVLRSLSWNIDITDKHNSELLAPYLKEDVEIVEMDFNAIALDINISMKELGWDKDKGKQYLINTYQKYSRFQLTDDELIEFADSLKELVKSHKSVA